MKRLSFVIAAMVAFSTLGVTLAVAVGIPEIDRANATIQLSHQKFKKVSCAGEDATNYTTWRGGWQGPEADFTPGSTDYNLTGTVTIRKAVWTVNLTTFRGVLKGNIALIDAAGVLVYAGDLTVITQGLPQGDQTVKGRGWIDAHTYFQGQPDRGSLLANVEFQFAPNLNAQAEFGDAPPNFGFPDFSVTTNNQNC